MSNAPPQPPRAASLMLWRAMGAFLTTLLNLFGGPERVAGAGILSRTEHALMLSWIKAGEAMLRRLLMIEAKALHLEPVTPRIARPRKPRVTHPHAFAAEAPELWRVSFRCAVKLDRQRHASAPAGVTPALHRYANAWPLAERIEAMLRVYDQPTGRARSLARWLQRHPDRAELLLEAPEGAANLIGAEAFDAAGQTAAAALQRRPDG